MEAESLGTQAAEGSRAQHVWRNLWTGFAVAALALVLMTGLAIRHMSREAESDLVLRSQSLVRALDLTVEGMVGSIDYALMVSADEMGRQLAGGRPDAGAINAFFARQQDRLPYLDLLRATNVEGEALFGKGVDPSQRASVAQRDYYRRLRDDPAAGLVFSEPIVGKLSQRWIWLMARRVAGVDGTFGGLVYGSLFVDALTRTLEQVRLAPGSAVSLRDQNLHVVARTTFDDAKPLPVGDAKLSDDFRAALALNRNEGTYRSGATSVDGVQRIYSYQRNARYGYTVMVGLPLSQAGAAWHQQAMMLGALTLTLLVAGLVGVRALARSWRRQSEQLLELAQGNARLAQIVELNPLPMALSDAQGRTELFNRKAVELLGYEREDVPTQADWMRRAYPEPERRAQIEAEWARRVQAAREGDQIITEREYEVRCKDGHTRLLSISGVILSGRLLVLFHDVTERVLFERALLGAKQAAEMSSEAKSRFLANMSHELRTPLNGILGMTELVRRKVTDPRLAGFLDKSLQASRQLQRIIGDILDISKVENGRLELHPAPVSVTDVLRHTQELLGAAAQEKGLDLSFDVAPSLRHRRFLGDLLRLQQVLANLVGNGVKFTGSGHVRVRVAEAGSDGRRTTLRWEIEDTGIGIPAHHQDRIFRMFEQVDDSLTRQYGGAGLGLALCKQIVTVMGGEIGVRSEAGQGSTFWFTVPLERLPEAQEPGSAGLPPTLEAAELALRERHSGRRVLLAEDEASSRDLAYALLSDACLDVAVARDGREAVALARAERFDLVLMDLRMPVMDGFDAARAIRTLPGYGGTPIVAVTANAFDDDEQACRDAGMSGFLAKPLESLPFHLAVLGWLDCTQTREAAV